MKTIFFDPGHGGHDPGAVGATALRESELTLYVAQRTREILQAANVSLQIGMSRETDRFVTLSQRATMANAMHADLFLSIHFNSAENHRARGHEVYTSPGETSADPFATDLFAVWCEEFPEQPARKDLGDGDPDKEAKFTVLRQTHMPAALYECGFISNRASETLFRDRNYLDRMAGALARGVLRHLGHHESPIKPVPPPCQLTVAELQQRAQLLQQDIDKLRLRLSS